MTTEQQVRIGIIGAGGILQVAHIPNLRSESSAQLVAVCDIDPARASLIAQRFEFPAWYDEPEKMLRDEDLDCVIIATPTITHLPLCQLALESGIDILIEKPFARNFEEAERIVSIAEKTDRLLMIGMNHRFRDDTTHLKNILKDNALGELHSINSGWLKRLGVWTRPHWFTDPKVAGGGVLLDLGLQMIDLILYLLDFPQVVEAVCSTDNCVLGLDVEDSANAFIRFDDDTTFLLDVSWANCSSKDSAYTVFRGSQGSASLNPLQLNRRQRDRIMAINIPGLGDESELYRNSFKAEISHFLSCVKNRTQPISSGPEALAVLEVIDRLYRSSGR